MAPGGAQAASEPPAISSEPVEYRIAAARLNGSARPHIDGSIGDAAWFEAAIIESFVQRNPNEGEAATESTVARILFDDEAIYIAVKAYDSEPYAVVGLLTRRDESSESDWIEISLDSFGDRRTAFDFALNPAGVQRDIYRYDDTWSDASWNAVWDGAARRDPDGWSAEFRIPFSQLRFSRGNGSSWGLQVTRRIARKNEQDLWKPIPKESSRWVSEYGELTGLESVQSPRRLELLPYALGETRQYAREEGNPFEDGSEWGGRYGLDLKYGITSDFTLDGTINPDFGQVEADPSEINLSAFESFFQEKRPFFIEGLDRFQFLLASGDGGAERLFYTRRIGRRPHGDADGDYVDIPNNTSILAAAKVTGKTSGGWAISVIDAVTAEQKATSAYADGSQTQTVVEPATNYAVGRVSKDFREGKSALGAIVTATNRRLGGTDMGYLHSAAYSVGTDFRHRFNDQGWEFVAKGAGSYVEGTPEAILDDQVSSARYYQRPDADHLSIDSTATSLSGAFGAARFGKFSGNLVGGLFAHYRTPGFETNDLGFMQQADFFNLSFWAGTRSFEPGKIFREHGENINAWHGQTTGGVRTSLGGNVNGWFELLNYWGGWWGFNQEIGSLSTKSLRGGPAILYPDAINWWGGVYTDSRKPLQLEVSGWAWEDAELSRAYGMNGYLRMRVSSSLNFSLGPGFNHNVDDWQYVTQDDAVGERQYIFAHLDQKTIALTTRLNWTFTPRLSLQVYAAPFISAGRYHGYKRVIDPRGEEYADRFETFSENQISSDGDVIDIDIDGSGSSDLSFDVPDFNFQQFRSNVVLRWEYMPGSALFLVYQHERNDFVNEGTFKPKDDFENLASLEGRNVFLVKLSYWWSL